VEIFSKIRKAIEKYLLQKQLSKRSRDRMVMGLLEAKNIGIVYDASTAADYRLVNQFVKTIEDRNLKVWGLGFIHDKKVPGYVNPHLRWDFFQSNDFSWDLSPRNSAITEFINIQFDILIDLAPAHVSQVKYVSAYSSAKYKVGIYHETQIDTYDLLLQVPGEAGLQVLMDQTMHYLKMIKKPSPDA
jgi:hypothetical protein